MNNTYSTIIRIQHDHHPEDVMILFMKVLDKIKTYVEEIVEISTEIIDEEGFIDVEISLQPKSQLKERG